MVTTYLPNPAFSARLGELAEAADYEDRPFPFDIPTLEIYATYECPFWETRTGVGQLAQVLFSDASDQIAMLAFYGDGSGEHGKGTGKIFVLAGYLANTLDWFNLERDWVSTLHEHPRIEYFKARECIRHQGEFSGQFIGWDQRDVEAKRLKFAEIIHAYNHRIVEIASTIRWDEYDSVIGDDVIKRGIIIHTICVFTDAPHWQ